eukprot:scaffold138810_cov21-Tisochrysis_lutea.AAC.1
MDTRDITTRTEANKSRAASPIQGAPAEEHRDSNACTWWSRNSSRLAKPNAGTPTALNICPGCRGQAHYNGDGRRAAGQARTKPTDTHPQTQHGRRRMQGQSLRTRLSGAGGALQTAPALLLLAQATRTRLGKDAQWMGPKHPDLATAMHMRMHKGHVAQRESLADASHRKRKSPT